MSGGPFVVPESVCWKELRDDHSTTRATLQRVGRALAWSLAATASAIGAREAIYVGGDVNLADQRGNTKSFRPGYYGVQVSGQIETSSESELVFDAGRRGALVIPYGAILSFEYSPGALGNVLEDAHERYWTPMRERVGVPEEASPKRRRPPALPYPWSRPYHVAEHYDLGIELQKARTSYGQRSRRSNAARACPSR